MKLNIIILLLLAGCASRPELPPLPPGAEARSAERGTRSFIAPRASVSQLWPVLTAAWNYNGTCDGFRLYHGTDLNRNTWTVIVDNIPPTNRTVQFQSSERGFIGLKAFNSAGESEWNR